MYSPYSHSDDRLSKLNGPWSSIWSSSPILAKLHSNLKDLPVAKRFPEILQTVLTHDVTIISGDMGTGKTLFVGPALAALDFRVLCTEPRRIAAHSPARYLNRLLEAPENTFIGVRTGVDKATNEHCPLLFCTDGLALVRALMQHGKKRDFLIIDEAHELNLNMELLLAWTRIQKKEGLKTRLILMSGTMDAERMAQYYHEVGLTVGRVEIKGQRCPYSLQPPQQTLTEDIRSLIGKASGVLIFVPGVRQILDTQRTLEQAGLDAQIFPLHGGLTAEQQQQAFQTSPNFKIVIATNLAESSVTVPGISAVIDYGTKNQLRSVNGVDLLETVRISTAERDQRWARSCRERPGIVIDRSCTSELPRAPYPIPEITRIDLSRAYLQFARIGIAMENLSFLNNPPADAIGSSKKKLLDLALIAEGPTATNLGKRVLELPVKVEFGIMLEEAKRLGVLGHMITGVAIMHAGGIIQRKGSTLVTQSRSALIEEIRIFNSLQRTRATPESLAQLQILEGNLATAERTRVELCKRLGVTALDDIPLDEEKLLRSITAGFIRNVYRQVSNSTKYIGPTGESWHLSDSFILRGEPIIVADPRIVATSESGSTTANMLLSFGSGTELPWLLEYAPHLFEESLSQGLAYSPKQNLVGRPRTFHLGKLEVSDGTVSATEVTPELQRGIIAEWLATETLNLEVGCSKIDSVPASLCLILAENAATVRRGRALNVRSGENRFPYCSYNELRAWYESVLGAGTRGIDLQSGQMSEALILPKPDKAITDRIVADSPDFLDIHNIRCKVAYPQNKAPLLRIDPMIISSGAIWTITNEEVSLPSGRACNLSITLGDTIFSAPTLSEARRILSKVLRRNLLQAANKEEVEIRRTPPPLAIGEIPKSIEVREGDSAIPPEFRPRVFGSWCPYKGETTDPKFQFEWYESATRANESLSRTRGMLTKILAPPGQSKPTAIRAPSKPKIVVPDGPSSEERIAILKPIREHCARSGFPDADVTLSRKCITVTVPVDAADEQSLVPLRLQLEALTDKPIAVNFDRRATRVHHLLLETLGDLPLVQVQYLPGPVPLIAYLPGMTTQRHRDFDMELYQRLGVNIRFIENCPSLPPFDYISPVEYSGKMINRGEVVDELFKLQMHLPSVFSPPNEVEIHADGIEVFTSPRPMPSDTTIAELERLCTALPFPVRVYFSMTREAMFNHLRQRSKG